MTDDADLEELLQDLDGDARQARLALLRRLRDDGSTLDELRQAVAEDRLVLLPVDRALRSDGRYTPQEVADRVGVDLEIMRASRAAFGLPPVPPDERSLTERDVEVTETLKRTLATGVGVEQIVELNRVIGRAMAQIAAASRAMTAESFMRPGATELDVAMAAAHAARELAPQVAPVLAFAYESHLRELLRSDVISSADIAAGRTPGARELTVAFADLVGFTRLGEQIAAEDLGAVVRRLEDLAGRRVEPPVQFVKTIGDAVMLVAPDTDALLDVALGLVEDADGEGESFPELRVGVGRGAALERAGDFYGSPVNAASRLTGVARPGSVLVSEAVRDAANDGWRWSFAGERKLKGLGPTKLFRARRGD